MKDFAAYESVLIMPASNPATLVVLLIGPDETLL